LSCPIKLKTGRKFCERTPYIKASGLYEKVKRRKRGLKLFYEAVQEEIDFLESLEC